MVVVDASVAYKWFHEEIDSSLALDTLSSHLKGKENILIPDLLLYELINAWSTKGNLKISHIKDNLKILRKYNLDVARIHFEMLPKIVELSKKYKISAYDSTYVMLAQTEKCHFLTADSKIVRQVNLPFVKHLSDYSIGQNSRG